MIVEKTCTDSAILPRDVPRLPVLDWQTLGARTSSDILSVSDGIEHVFTSSGRAAIMLGLELLGVGQGNQVLVPTYHCPTMVAPIIAVGAEPLFYPINDKGEAQLDQISVDPERLKAVIVPHFFGIPQDLSRVRAFCDRLGISLIEDCAHCFFGLGEKRIVGYWGDIAIASLTKFFPVPAGGILAFPRGASRKLSLRSPGMRNQLKAVVDILETAVEARRLRGFGALLRGVFSLKRSLRRNTSGSDALSEISDTPLPQALAFDVALAHQAPEWICRRVPSVIDRTHLAERRRHNYLKLAKVLSGHRGFSPVFPELPTNAVPYVFPLRVEQPDSKYHELRRSGLPVFRWNWLWPGTPVICGDSGLVWSSQVFQLACHQNLTEEELDCICSTVIRVCSASSAGQ